MSYTSFIYLGFLAVTCLIYYVFPLKIRWLVLVMANIVFYGYAGWDNLVYLLGAIVISYLVALKMGSIHE